MTLKPGSEGRTPNSWTWIRALPRWS